MIAPDLIGFGKSDKPARKSDYSYETHVAWMRSFIERNSSRITMKNGRTSSKNELKLARRLLLIVSLMLDSTCVSIREVVTWERVDTIIIVAS